MSAFTDGQKAAVVGMSQNDNPHTCGFTKLGAIKLTEEGIEWDNGWKSAQRRVASKTEMQAAATIDVSRFRRKSNNYYK